MRRILLALLLIPLALPALAGSPGKSTKNGPPYPNGCDHFGTWCDQRAGMNSMPPEMHSDMTKKMDAGMKCTRTSVYDRGKWNGGYKCEETSVASQTPSQ
jgi:hypothetical protein